MKLGRLGLCLSTALAVGVATAQAETVKVGLILPFSGGSAEFGEQIERGIRLYLKTHPDALGGHQVEFVRRDSKRPGGDVAKTATQELVLRENVKILAGYETSPDAIASAPIATSAKVPMLVLNAATAWITNLSPYIVRVGRTMWQSSYPLGTYAYAKLGCRTAAVGYTDYPPGKDSLDAFKLAFEKAGGSVTEAIPMGGPATVPDFTPFLQRVKAGKPDCFYAFVPGGNHSGAIMKVYDDLGFRDAGIRMIGAGDLTQDTRLRKAGPGAVGIVTMMDYSADYKTPANQGFIAAWQKEYGADSVPDFFAVYGYDGGAAIARMIKATDGKVEPEKAVDALRGWQFQSPRGLVTIDPQTRDTIMDQHVQRVVMMGGRPGIEVIETIEQIKDPCKELKIGRCGEAPAQ